MAYYAVQSNHFRNFSTGTILKTFTNGYKDVEYKTFIAKEFVEQSPMFFKKILEIQPTLYFSGDSLVLAFSIFSTNSLNLQLVGSEYLNKLNLDFFIEFIENNPKIKEYFDSNNFYEVKTLVEKIVHDFIISANILDLEDLLYQKNPSEIEFNLTIFNKLTKFFIENFRSYVVEVKA